MRASALVFTHVSEEHDFGASVFGEVLDVYGAHVLSQVAGANLITTLGLCFVILNVSLVLYFSPELDGSSPNWVYAVCAVGFWIYQTMDGMDGKQARRTGTGSPLGEVVDHGCDAFSGVRVRDYFVRRVFVQRQDESVVGVRDYELWQMEFWVGYGHEHVSRVVAD